MSCRTSRSRRAAAHLARVALAGLLAGCCCQRPAPAPAPGFDESVVSDFARTEVEEAVDRALAEGASAGRELASERRARLEALTHSLVESFETLRLEVPEVHGDAPVDVSGTRGVRDRALSERDALVAGAPIVALEWLGPLLTADRYLARLDELLAAADRQEPQRDRPAFVARYQALATAYNEWAEAAEAATVLLNTDLEAAMLPPTPGRRGAIVAEALRSDWPATWPAVCRHALAASPDEGAARRRELALAARRGAFAVDAAADLDPACRAATLPLVDAVIACRAHAEGAVSTVPELSADDVAAIVEAAATRFLEQRDAACAVGDEGPP